MNRWLRVVLPDWPSLFVSICIWQLIVVTWNWYRMWRGDLEFLGADGAYFVRLLACGYAVFRVVTFHPLWRIDYRQWLERTPWTPRHPLPLGPLHLVPQDVVWLLVITLLGWVPSAVAGLSAAYLWQIWKAFGLTFLLVHAMTLRMTGDLLHSYAVGFLLGLVAYAWPSHGLSLGLEVLTYLVVHRGVRRSLERFPWSIERWERMQKQLTSNEMQTPVNKQNGWPFAAAGPALPAEFLCPRGDLICISLLAGWWMHVADVFWLRFQLQEQFNPVVFIGFAIVAALPPIRAAFYFLEHRPPIGLWGRILTGRWIIPQYDVIFVAPLLAMVCGVALPMGGLTIPLLRPYLLTAVIPVTTTLMLLINFGIGPELRVWHFTGRHRLVSLGSMMKLMIRVG